DCDFLGCEGGSVSECRDWAAGRYRPGTQPGREAADAQMSRLYVVEPMMTLTGGQADHRVAVKPSRVGAVAIAIAAATLTKLGASDASQYARLAAELAGPDLPDATWIEAVADDL